MQIEKLRTNNISYNNKIEGSEEDSNLIPLDLKTLSKKGTLINF